MPEQWISTSPGVAEVRGRELVSWRKKINPIWWFGNDEEPTPPDWYMPGQARWLRIAAWYVRNPLQNFGKYVIGVCDRNYVVRGLDPVMATTWDDAGKPGNGWKWSAIELGHLRLPFVSYSGKKWLFYAGVQWWGFAGLKVNRKSETAQLL